MCLSINHHNKTTNKTSTESRQEDQATKMREEHLLKEGSKLLEIEQKVQRELKDKEQELWSKEQQLQTLEIQAAGGYI